VELKMLRELAKASFAQRKRAIDEYGTKQGMGSDRGGIGTLVDVFFPAKSPQRRDKKQYTRLR
jgi:hypothetical protein